MMRKTIQVAKSLLPIPIFFVLISMVYAQNSADINVIITTFPSSEIECKPDVLTIGSDIKWINCFIELDGANVANIDLSTVSLSVVSKPSNILADQTFSYLGDFDLDGNPDLQVRFNRTKADQFWFSVPNLYTLQVSGYVLVFPFSGNDTIQVIKNPDIFSRYFEFNAYPSPGKINRIYGINVNNYTPTYTHFNGYFFSIGDPKLFGVNAFYSQGTLRVEKTLNFWLFSIKIIDDQPITISAVFDKYDDCNTNFVDEISCEGSGILIISNKKTGWRFQDTLNTFRFEIKNNKIKMEGGKIWNDMISVSDIFVNKITIR